MKKQTWQERDRIIEKYLASVKDSRVRLMCFLLMRDIPEREICETLHMDQQELNGLKLQTAIELRQSGIRLGDE